MKIETMRAIDVYAGRPLCALVSLWVWLQDLLSLSQTVRKNSARKVLFIELSEMGSAILADSSLRWTRDQGAEIYFVIFARNVGSLKLLNTVPLEHIFLIRETNFWILTWDTLRFLLWCRTQKITTVVDLELFSRFTSLLTGLSGAGERVGFHAFHNEGLYRGSMLTHEVAYNPHVHIAKNFMALVKSIWSSSSEVPYLKDVIHDEEIRPLQAAVSAEGHQRVWDALEALHPHARKMKWVIFNCAGGEFLPQRRWPASHYAKLAQLFLDQNPDCGILLTGSPHERHEVDQIRVLSQRDRIFNFAGNIQFLDLISLYQISRMMISNDSGPAHFASVTNLPTFVFFGPETPALYGSLGNFRPLFAGFHCSPCVTAGNHRKTPCTDNKCLQVISPESVYRQAVSIL